MRILVVGGSGTIGRAVVRGFEPVPAARAALAYAKSVDAAQTGQVYRV
jgi:uncharacterized protein YbjT (DUF2867 family)